MNVNCYECVYRKSIPGDCHSCCTYPGNDYGLFSFFSSANLVNKVKLNIIAERCGVQNGWFFWPCNFDPVWLVNCNGFKEKEMVQEN